MRWAERGLAVYSACQRDLVPPRPIAWPTGGAPDGLSAAQFLMVRYGCTMLDPTASITDTYAGPPTPRSRARRAGPEQDLLSAALRTLSQRYSKHSPLVFLEPELPTGFPDAIMAYPSRYFMDSKCTARMQLTPRHLRLLHHIYAERGTSVRELMVSLQWTERRICNTIADLTEAGFLRTRGARVTANSLRNIFALKKIVAIEAKINNWRGALEQAIGNTWFASESYVLLPERPHLQKVIAEAEGYGVGVLSCNGNDTRTLLRAAKRRLPLSYGSWLINEWTIQRLQAPQEQVHDRH